MLPETNADTIPGLQDGQDIALSEHDFNNYKMDRIFRSGFGLHPETQAIIR